MYLLDTNALSEPLKVHPHPGFMKRIRNAPSDGLYTSTVCATELRYGCARKHDMNLRERIKGELLIHIRVLPFGRDEAVIAGDLLAALHRAGRPFGIEDIQIAATALPVTSWSSRRMWLISPAFQSFVLLIGWLDEPEGVQARLKIWRNNTRRILMPSPAALSTFSNRPLLAVITMS